MTKYSFHGSVQLQKGNHSDALIAHTKYTLSNPDDPDTVLCLVVRRRVPPDQVASATQELMAEEGKDVRDFLIDLEEDFRWLGPEKSC